MKKKDNQPGDSVPGPESIPVGQNSDGHARQALRQKAETIAYQETVLSTEFIQSMSLNDIASLIHELQVYQIELSMQNEELRRAQIEIEKTQTRFFDIYNLSPVGYCTLSEKGLILEINLTAATLFGISRKSLINQPFSQYILTEDQDIYYHHRKHLFETRNPQSCDLRMNRTDNTWFCAHINATVSHDPDGNLMCHIVINDITEQKKAETALRESEEKYRLLYTSMEQGLALHEIISDENGKPVDYVFLDLNDSYTRILGITRDMAIGKRITEVMPKVEQYWIDVFGKVALTGESSYYENYLETTGKYYSTYSYCPKKNQFAVLVTDISERRKGEELLRKNESRHRAMMANISDVIAIIDPEGIIRYKSSNIERWFGWHPDDLVGASTWINVHPGDLDRIQNFFGFVTSKTDESGTVECRYMCKDGHYKWIEVTAVNRFHDPDIQGVLLNYHDISDRKKTEEEKLKLESQLRQAQKMESVGRLAGGVAHDFNNMLGVILGHVEMAQDQLDSAHPVFADMEEIRHAARRSADITRQLLAFARKQTVVPKQLDLNHTIQGMLNMLRRLIGENIDLTWKPGLDLWSVMVDPSQIDQILANLCVNARDGISGVGKITVETKNSTFDDDYCANHQGFIPGDYVQVSLSDNGCGMDKEILDNIFEPFFTTKGVGKGTGLGLSTVYGVIKQNNGFINVYSEPGHGSIFTFYLPRYVSKDMIKVINDFIEPSMGGHETILLVEDEPAILRMTGKMLRTQGYTVIEARTPGEAIYLAREHTGELHMLLTDVVMPEMNGRDLAHNLLMLYPNIKRLFMSGYTANVIAPHGVLDHGVHFIQKPFSKNELAAKVRDTLDYKS